MRIGIDCRLWSETGVGRYTRNLIRELDQIDKQNHCVLFALSKDAEDIQNQISKIKVGEWKLVNVDIRWHTVQEQLAFPKVLSGENLDLMHFPYFSVPIFYNRPFVVTIHDLIIHHFPTGQASTLPYPLYWLKLQGYKYVIQHAAKKAQKVITVSNATKQEIIDHIRVSEDKIIVTYEGIDDAIRLKHNYQYTSISSLTPYFLYVGNAYPHKNLKRLIDAFHLVRSRHSNVSLVLVGKNDYFYHELKKSTNTNGIVFYEVKNDKELAALYQHAEALVMPSLMEGFGLPPLEAMANNCLVLASDIPSFREICNNAAIYFDAYAPDAIAKTMLDCLSNSKDMQSYKEKGLKQIKKFSWKKMAEQTLAIYETCSR